MVDIGLQPPGARTIPSFSFLFFGGPDRVFGLSLLMMGFLFRWQTPGLVGRELDRCSQAATIGTNRIGVLYNQARKGDETLPPHHSSD
jgi:hypothetical protein